MGTMGEESKGNSRVPLYRQKNIQIIYCVTLMAVLGVSSITPAFPKIVHELGISTQSVGLLITSFTFPGIFLTPILGVFADRYGRKKILIPSLLLFGVAGGSCVLARDFETLLMLRFLQGVGAASLGALNVTLIGDLYSGRQRTAAMGYNASVLSVGTALYPTIGGALATLEWYFPFILPVLGIPVALIVLFSLKNPEPYNDQDLREYLSSAWKSIATRRVLGLFTAGIITFIILFGSYLTCFPLFMGESFGASPFVIGLVMSTMSLTTAITSWRLGKMAAHFSGKTLLRISYIIYAAALIMITISPSLLIVIVPAAMSGIANGINIPIIHSMLAGLAPMEHRAAFMSINSMVFRMGQTLGPLLMGSVFGLYSMAGAFYAGALLAVLMLILLSFVKE
jgi:MFS family permease